MKNFFLFFILAICCAGLKAQVIPPRKVIDPNAPIIKLEADTFNFGTVKQGTRIEHDFKFTNTGKSPLIIYSHSTGCSCTDIYYPKEPIAPGKSGVLHFIFDTDGKMGAQVKRGVIESNNKYETIELYLKGNVIPQQIIPPIAIDTNGPVMTFETTVFDFGIVNQGTVIDHEFRFTNTGKQPLLISSTHGSGNNTPSSYPKEPIQPGGKGTILFRLDNTGKSGIQDKTVTVTSNSIYGDIVLHLTGYVIVPASPVDTNGPVMTFETTTFDFGNAEQNTIIEHEYKFTNTGKQPLIISEANGSGHSTVPEYPKEPIRPGGTAAIRFKFNTAGKMGRQDKTVTVTSNSINGIIVLHLKGNVIIPPPPIDPNAPVMTFDSLTYNFGTVIQGTQINKEFHFTNTGKSPLIISNVVGSGSTYAEYPKEPIAPGKSGIIKVLFPTEARMGMQDKVSVITCNDPRGTIVLHIKGNVIARETPPPSHNAIMTFDSTTYHFPKTPQGKVVTLDIPFKNTGTEPLIISTCMSACGCDVAEAPKEPIAPGKTGMIKYTLNTESRMGKQQKTFTVVYNTDQVIVITIYGEIIPADTPH
jgi:hypothetical protein